MPTIIPYNNIIPKISPNAFIAESAVIIGDVEIEDGASIWFGCVVRGDVNYIRIGQNTNVQDNSTIHVATDDGPTIIGDNVTIGHNCLIHACILESNSFVGMASTVMDFATIKSNAMLGAGSLLTGKKTIQQGELWLGNPASFKRNLRDEELEHIPFSAKRYVKLATQYKT